MFGGVRRYGETEEAGEGVVPIEREGVDMFEGGVH